MKNVKIRIENDFGKTLFVSLQPEGDGIEVAVNESIELEFTSDGILDFAIVVSHTFSEMSLTLYPKSGMILHNINLHNTALLLRTA